MNDESHQQAHTASGEPVPDPGSGTIAESGEPMTDPQRTHLQTLCEEAGEPFDGSLSGADADRRIQELERRLPGRGQD
jgi:hypothetical protein